MVAIMLFFGGGGSFFTPDYCMGREGRFIFYNLCHCASLNNYQFRGLHFCLLLQEILNTESIPGSLSQRIMYSTVFYLDLDN